MALLTPNFDGRIWYEKDEKNLKLTIYTSPESSIINNQSSVEVSYRLTAPRFDWRDWANTSESKWEGLNLDTHLAK